MIVLITKDKLRLATTAEGKFLNQIAHAPERYYIIVEGVLIIPVGFEKHFMSAILLQSHQNFRPAVKLLGNMFRCTC